MCKGGNCIPCKALHEGQSCKEYQEIKALSGLKKNQQEAKGERKLRVLIIQLLIIKYRYNTNNKGTEWVKDRPAGRKGEKKLRVLIIQLLIIKYRYDTNNKGTEWVKDRPAGRQGGEETQGINNTVINYKI